MFQIGLKKLLWLKKLKALVYFISDLKSEEIAGMFYEEELLKTNWKEFKAEKVIKRNVMHYMLNGKATIVLLIVGLINKI